MSRAEDSINAFVSKVYGWMFAGLAVSAVTALYTMSSPVMLDFLKGGGLFFLVFGELGFVIALSAAMGKLSSSTAMFMFIVYAALNGMTLSIILLLYTASSVASTLFITAGVFGAMAVYGHVTKHDLTSVGSLCFMGLIGLVIASIVNIFLRSSSMQWALTYLGILVFIGLTAYDAQKIKAIGAGYSEGSEVYEKAAILGALALYLDFINLFIMLLRLFGRRR